MPRIVHKQKGPFGETIYTDENYRVIGTSQKGLFGEEIFLDKDSKYAGSKQKGILGEDRHPSRPAAEDDGFQS